MVTSSGPCDSPAVRKRNIRIAILTEKVAAVHQSENGGFGRTPPLP